MHCRGGNLEKVRVYIHTSSVKSSVKCTFTLECELTPVLGYHLSVNKLYKLQFKQSVQIFAQNVY